MQAPDMCNLFGPIICFAWNNKATIPVLRKVPNLWMLQASSGGIKCSKLQRVIQAFAHFHTRLPPSLADDCLAIWDEYQRAPNTATYVAELLELATYVDQDKILHDSLVSFIDQIVQWYKPRVSQADCKRGKYCKLPYCVCNIGNQTQLVSQATNTEIEHIYDLLTQKEEEEEEEEEASFLSEDFCSDTDASDSDTYKTGDDGYQTEDERDIVLAPETPPSHKRKIYSDDFDTIVYETPMKR